LWLKPVCYPEGSYRFGYGIIGNKIERHHATNFEAIPINAGVGLVNAKNINPSFFFKMKNILLIMMDLFKI